MSNTLFIPADVNLASLNEQLSKVFSNGKSQAGLEIGQDPGLASKDYIQIPEEMKRQAYSYTDPKFKPVGDFAHIYSGGGVSHEPRIIVHSGKAYEMKTKLEEVQEFVQEEPTYKALLYFIRANRAHCGAENYHQDHMNFVIAVRYWAVIHGLVTTSKNEEYVEVPNPADNSITAEDYAVASFVIKYKDQAITACAARAASWRKTNHCTGGQIAAGFVRRFLETQNMWPHKDVGEDDATYKNRLRAVTNAFYYATHAVSVHAVLAVMAPEDSAHWAEINTIYGFVKHIECLESVRIRISPKTQVAGVAIVVDSVVVLSNMMSEGIAGLLSSSVQLDALATAYNSIKAHGVRMAVYARWFLDGHPLQMKPIEFSQKDIIFSNVCGELAIVGTIYYDGSTISKSPSLMNAARNQGSESARTTWQAISRLKDSITGQALIQAYSRMKSGVSRKDLDLINSDEESDIGKGVDEYNKFINETANKFGFSNVMKIDKDVVIDYVETESETPKDKKNKKKKDRKGKKPDVEKKDKGNEPQRDESDSEDDDDKKKRKGDDEE